LLAPALVAAVCVAGASNAAPRPAPPNAATRRIAAMPRAELQRKIAADSARAVTTWIQGHPDSGIRIFQPLVTAAPHVADSTLRARILLLDASFKYRRARLPEAMAALDAIRRMAEAGRDTLALIRGLMLESGVREARGESEGLEAPMRRCLALAEVAGQPEYVGNARYRLGVLARYRGDFEMARRELRAAIAIFDSLGSTGSLRNAINQLGNVEFTSGRYREARPYYERSLRLAQAAGDLVAQAHAQNNLGAVEVRVGDLRRAAEHVERGRALFREGRSLVNEMYTVGNVAELRLLLGQVDRARAALEEGIAAAERGGLVKDAADLRRSLGTVMARAGRPAQAKAIWRQVIALPDETAPGPQAESMVALAAQLAAEDSLAAAIRTVRAALDHAGLTEADDIAVAKLHLAEMLNRSGRFEEALATVRALADTLDRREDNLLSISAWTQVVVAERRLGRLAAATEHFAVATRCWERMRGETSSLELREAANDDARTLMGEGIALALAAPGSASRRARFELAFDRMQRFKTRSLLERMRGPRATELAPPSLPTPWSGTGRFVRERLAPGELLLEYAAGPDTTWLFALARDTVVLVGLPSGERLGGRVALGRDLLATPPAAAAPNAAVVEAARGQGALLLGPVRGLISRAHTLIVAPDAWLHRVPFAALIAGAGGTPLAATHDVVIVPSATLLDAVRSGPDPGGSGVLAIRGAPRRDESALAGALREVRELVQRYLGVEEWNAAAARSAAPTLDGYLALHFAGHSVVDDQFPWASGIVIGRGADSRDSLLTAGEIADRRLGARLVVLSSCESAAGRTNLGEGVAGLSTAFLAAGVPAVVATLWPVEDRVTADLMSRLYDQLARGRSAAEALRRAQLEVRGRPATRHPYYWAGFVLVGDGSVRLPLRRRPGLRFGGWPAAGAAR